MNISFNNFQNVNNRFSFGSKHQAPKRVEDKSPRSDFFERDNEDVIETYNKGIYGQDLYDELNCLNRIDPSSCYYESNHIGLVYNPESSDGKDWYGY